MNYVSQENMDNIVKGMSRKLLESVANSAVIGDTTPVGTIISFMGTQAPDFYLICDGTTYNIADYKELADFIEFQFGTVNYFGGDGTTTFAVPDLRGEFLRGTGTNSHTNQGNGASVGIHQDGTEFPNIWVWGNNSNRVDINVNQLNWKENLLSNTDSQYNLANNITEYHQTNNAQVSSGYYTDFTSRPTNTSVLYCIKYTKAVIPSEYEDGTPVGRVIFDCILREGYIKANGAQIEDATIAIPRLLSFVQKYSSQILAPDQATYEANVGLYMYDSNNDILTLPNYIGRFMEGGNSVESIEAGLPNIKGTIHSRAYAGNNVNAGAITGGTSAFSKNIESSSTLPSGLTSSGNYNYIKFSFNATNSNSIYSDSVTTVQPSSITLIPQIRY